VQAELQQALPPRLQPLAGPAAGGLHQLAPQVAQRALETSRVQELWGSANRSAHEALLNVLNGGSGSVSTGNGEVKLDLSTLVQQVGSQLGVGGNLASKLPVNSGQVTILKSSQLSTAQDVAKLVRHAPIVLTLLLILLYGLAIYFAGERRRAALRSVGICFAIAGVLALIARSVAGTQVVNALASTESVRPAAQATWEIGTSLLVTVASSAIAFGVLLFLGAWIAGPTRLAVSLRRDAAPYVREYRGWAYAIAAIVYIALIAWAPIAAFRKPLGILIFLVLFALGAELLRRQILREFPAGETGHLGERMRARASGLSAAVTGRRGVPEPAAATTGAGEDKVAQLERLAALHESGALSDEEFVSAKNEVLGAGKTG
jgi:hypothetical protein